ncbi:VOC family protein [Streptomyces mirabilis]|uniref:VOC family protein n=1 Tax=Streptomyces mirabilis TaxID=68239 RepID=UPI0037235460
MARTQHPYARGDLVVVIGCHDLDRPARFWTAALGSVAEGEPVKGAAAGKTSCGMYRRLRPHDGQGIEILLQRTADMKGRGELSSPGLAYPGPNRRGPPGHRLGSGRAHGRPVRETGRTWHILADPDGNDFCVMAPPCFHDLDQRPTCQGAGRRDSRVTPRHRRGWAGIPVSSTLRSRRHAPPALGAGVRNGYRSNSRAFVPSSYRGIEPPAAGAARERNDSALSRRAP